MGAMRTPKQRSGSASAAAGGSRANGKPFSALSLVILLLVALLFWWGQGGLVAPASDVTSSPAPTAMTASIVVAPSPVPSTLGARSASGLPTIQSAQLPPEAQTTLARIAAGGAFPYSQDGATFQNRERLLPRQASGYYREYTVRTPGEDDRGARRIVAGAGGELYYTDDHYASFWEIAP